MKKKKNVILTQPHPPSKPYPEFYMKFSDSISFEGESHDFFACDAPMFRRYAERLEAGGKVRLLIDHRKCYYDDDCELEIILKSLEEDPAAYEAAVKKYEIEEAAYKIKLKEYKKEVLNRKKEAALIASAEEYEKYLALKKKFE